ncbi:dioxygenase, partial [Actinomadura logoneensis]
MTDGGSGPTGSGPTGEPGGRPTRDATGAPSGAPAHETTGPGDIPGTATSAEA